MNHAVRVDWWRWLAWDNEERFAVDLNVDSIHLCTAIKAKEVRVRALEVVAQREKKTQKMAKTVEVIELD